MIFGVVIALLIALIGYFVYLLMAPEKTSDQTKTNQTVNTPVTKEKTNQKKKTDTNSTTTTNEETNTNDNENTNATTTDEDEAGLVEPQPDGTTTDEETADEEDETEAVVAGEGEQVVTLYFTKIDSSCGQVFPVKRAVTPEEDLYGQIILADIAGPTEEETGYTSAMPSGLRLRRVEYTAAGPVIYVNEAFSDADNCDQKTVEAQLVETANAMFDFPKGTAGEVIVGYPDDVETTEEEETAEEEEIEEEETTE